ncbi:hypothetical protein [Lactiplantibacillus plantarum]|uniref:hypothetical protein n=1 Tax=Lactiplantibacillus plantarum TaxID=1590 RepID=UPI000760444F|nr:hypothetical protein [Lactiplantibacillus plantarum]KWT50307.1 hypothetical protein ABB42_11135 [Lactiplantibacillus plantarum]
MAIKLATNELSAVNDSPFRNLLISNFETIEQAVNDIEKLISDDKQTDETDKKNQQDANDQALNYMEQKINDKIKRITLGTDEDIIRLVVTAILKEQGVIK